MTGEFPISRRAVLPVLAAAVTVPWSGVAAGTRIEIALTPEPQGFAPAGFAQARTGRGAASDWRIRTVADTNVLEQTATDPTDYRFPLAIYQNLSAADLEVSVRFKAIAGRVDRAGGIAIRLRDPDHYYVVRANALEDNVNFYRVANGIRQESAGVSVKVVSGVWHDLGLRAEGDRFDILYNGAMLFQVADRTFPVAGKIALWTKADSLTQFAGLSVTTRP